MQEHIHLEGLNWLPCDIIQVSSPGSIVIAMPATNLHQVSIVNASYMFTSLIYPTHVHVGL